MSQSVWNWVLAAVALVVAAAVALAWTWWYASREVVTPLSTVNASGSTGRALLVFHPGMSDFPQRITTAFADGLAQAGWRVDRTTASRQAVAELSAYDLIVLGSPVYANSPAKPLADYVRRIADFSGKPVVLVYTAAGDASVALQSSAAIVSERHGKVVGRFGYTTQRPNESAKAYPGSNTDRAVAMARDAARSLAAAPN